jgi:DNA-binding IclR family transcriptional regulator
MPSNLEKNTARVMTRRLTGVEKAFAILQSFSADVPELTALQIANTTGINRTTVHRLLKVMEANGWVWRAVDSSRFCIGMNILQLANVFEASFQLPRVLRNFLAQVLDATGETTSLWIPERGSAVCVDKIESPQPLRLSVQLAQRRPFHAGAGPKLLLAFKPPREIRTVLSRPLERIGPKTITAPSRLRLELATIRRRGYSTSEAEIDFGAYAIAVPVRDYQGKVAAAIDIAGPCERLKARRSKLISALLGASVASSAALGWPSQPLPGSTRTRGCSAAEIGDSTEGCGRGAGEGDVAGSVGRVSP